MPLYSFLIYVHSSKCTTFRTTNTKKKKKEKETQQSTSLAFCILTSWTMKTAFQNFF